MYEFDPTFVIDTGNLHQVFTGSGVHLYKDVSMSFDLFDQQLNPIVTDKDLIYNPLVSTIVFDILRSDRSVASGAFISGGTSKSISFTKEQNEEVFGNYTKDFGIRLSVFNSFDNSSFTGEFYAYANTPNITGVTVYDGSDPIYNSNNEQQIYDELIVFLELENDPKYTALDRFDIYVSTGACSLIELYETDAFDPTLHPDFLFSQVADTIDRSSKIHIKPVGLDYDVPYYFKIVPYSQVGSGASICVGPHVFTSAFTGSDIILLRGNELELFEGDSAMNMDFVTGYIDNTTGALLDSIESGVYRTILYTAQIKNGADEYTSTELKLVLNNTGISFLESPINNTGQLLYTIDQSGLYYNLFVSGVSGSGEYKLFKTSI